MLFLNDSGSYSHHHGLEFRQAAIERIESISNDERGLQRSCLDGQNALCDRYENVAFGRSCRIARDLNSMQ